jgi:hypothetical protein
MKPSTRDLQLVFWATSPDSFKALEIIFDSFITNIA